MTELDYLVLAAGIFFLVTALLGLVRPNWVWHPAQDHEEHGPRLDRRRLAVTAAYAVLGVLLLVAGAP